MENFLTKKLRSEEVFHWKIVIFRVEKFQFSLSGESLNYQRLEGKITRKEKLKLKVSKCVFLVREL